MALVNANVAFLLTVYQEPTTNLWEERVGYSFFARAAQLRCFEEVLATPVADIDKPDGLRPADRRRGRHPALTHCGAGRERR
ncbi:hypothetical protein AB0J72_46445 [Dactylosporangium sp. NPDC049742]|uniref:hypothetical protein n=1 Tax=Dactylosporangium sp. NPDC049742 TaxID=3154737 RepID=UPI00343B00CC